MKKKINLIPIALFLIFFLLLNIYTLSGFQTLNPNPAVPLFFWAVILFVAAASLVAIRRFLRLGHDQFFRITMHVLLILVVSEMIFSIFLIPGDLYGLARHQQRNLNWTRFAELMFFVMIILFIYGMLFGKYAYRVVRHTLTFADLPTIFHGFTITQISDVHAGSFNNPKAVQKGIDLIKAQQSDLFVFTGDLVNNKATEIIPWIPYFSQIKAPYGQFSILGNHDYGDYVKWDSEAAKKANLQNLKQQHAALGYRLLLDEHVVLEKEGESIILAGVENWGLGFGERGDLQKALRHTDPAAFKILLSHDPSHWEAQVKQNPVPVQLTLSGHTHGMQFGIELFGIKWSPVKFRYAHWAGIKEENGRYININRGFGFIGFSGRIGIWPEITVITLKKG